MGSHKMFFHGMFVPEVALISENFLKVGCEGPFCEKHFTFTCILNDFLWLDWEMEYRYTVIHGHLCSEVIASRCVERLLVSTKLGDVCVSGECSPNEIYYRRVPHQKGLLSLISMGERQFFHLESLTMGEYHKIK